MSTPPEAPATLPPLTTAEVAYLIRLVWNALLAPQWGPGTRKDLEKLGLALYSGKSLRDLDDDLYERLLPHLKVVATSLGHALQQGGSPDPLSTPTSAGSQTPGSQTPPQPPLPAETTPTQEITPDE